MPGEIHYTKEEAAMLRAALALSFEEQSKYSVFFEHVAAKRHIEAGKAWKTYATSGAAIVGTYLMMVGHIVEDANDKRAILGTLELAKIQQYVNENFTCDQSVAIQADIVMRDYGNGDLPILRPPFHAYDPQNALTSDPPPPHLYLHGGRPGYLPLPPKDPPGWRDQLANLFGLQKTAVEAMQHTEPVSPDAVEKLNQFIRDLEKKARTTQQGVQSAAPDTDAPIQIADAPKDKADEVDQNYRDVVDLPLAPPDAAVVAAAAVRAFTAAEPPSDPPDASTPDFPTYLAMRTWFLRRLRQLGEQQVANRPPVPPYPGPGAVVGDYGFSFDQITNQDGQNTELDGSGPGGAFQALMRAVPALKSFHEVDGKLTNESALTAMLIGGRWRASSETIAPGDIVRVADPMLQGGYGWLVALEATQRVVTRGLTVFPGGSRYHMIAGNTGETVGAWHPIPQLILQPNSQVGAFWGTGLARMRRLLVNYLGVLRGSVGLDSFVHDVSSGTAYAANDFDGFVSKIGRELRYIEPTLPIYTGCILLTESDEELGVVLGDGSILGLSQRSAFGAPARLPWVKFRARYIWYPRPAPV